MSKVMNNTKPIMRSTDMRPQVQTIVLRLAQQQMDMHYDIQNKIFEISTRIKQELHREFIESKEEDYDYNTNPWSVAVGKNFSVVTDGKRGWFAHVYLKNTVSMLVWRTV